VENREKGPHRGPCEVKKASTQQLTQARINLGDLTMTPTAHPLAVLASRMIADRGVSDLGGFENFQKGPTTPGVSPGVVGLCESRCLVFMPVRPR
jgi:hypothetical protein